MGIAKIRISLGFVFSVSMHAAVAALILHQPTPVQPPTKDRLVIEIQGIIAERQIEQSSAGSRTHAQKAATSTQEASKPNTTPEPSKPREAQPPAPKVVVTKPNAIPLPKASATPIPDKPARPQVQEKPQPVAKKPEKTSKQPTATPVTTKESTDSGQGQQQAHMQQSIAHQPQQADLIKQYLKTIRRLIQSNLIYPSEARRDGSQGIPVISFRIAADGSILSGSLRIARSSGHPALDRHALQAASASAPFIPPPRAMEVSIAISFNTQSR
ncbi:protein TonB [Azomonas agilis]|uniref:Protein TonB n=2 Tax=Azomonas agilis TaxID=116849 RepID=A0A562J057_9GAMM|nr:protein TonB [Azomonas agilis]